MPITFSEQFNISKEVLEITGVFDAILDIDTRVFIDPALLELCTEPEFLDARKKVEKYFSDIITLLRHSKSQTDMYRKRAERMLTFTELSGTCFGYSQNGTGGNAIGSVLRKTILNTIQDLMTEGDTDPVLFELLGVFQEGIGCDRVSDLITFILREDMLKVEKKDFPEYIYEDAVIRDAYNEAALELEKKHLVQLEWVKGRPVLSAIVLRLDQISQCYAFAERMHPKVRASQIIQLIDGSMKDVAIPWIIAWKVDVCRSAAEQLKIPVFCKTDDTPLQDLLCAFREYSALPGSITMRAFSSKCFSDTKYFERNVRDLFLRIARKYDADLANSCDENELGEREQLAYLGIYARPELYELAGNCLVRTEQGTICIGAAPYGLALPSTLIDSITAIDLTAIQCITFIENKTNYDEYVMSEKQPGELVIYHGGFLSPQKRKLVTMIAHAAAKGVKVRFWADIDAGGFRMFDNLQKLISSVLPMRMSGELVEKFYEHGLVRSKEYLSELEADLKSGRYLLFKDAIEKILSYGVTIEQETFLN